MVHLPFDSTSSTNSHRLNAARPAVIAQQILPVTLQEAFKSKPKKCVHVSMPNKRHFIMHSASQLLT
jgi:hypothetical protein